MRAVGTDELGRMRRVTLRSLLRALGPAAMMGGTYFLVDGLSDYFATLTDINGPTLTLGEPVAGLSLLLAGGGATVAAWLGRRGRNAGAYELANEAGQPEVTDLSGLSCPRCLHINEAGADVCSACGSYLESHLFCPRCRHENDFDAHFCDNCGQALGGG
jgi:phage FluMu protein Com